MISGPNGGGKTAALKSFGLAAVLGKLGVPIISSSSEDIVRVDFFRYIHCEIGDNQSLIEGQSTLMAKLSSLAEISQRISHGTFQQILILITTQMYLQD